METTIDQPRKPGISLTTQIFIGLGLGVLVGFTIHRLFDGDNV